MIPITDTHQHLWDRSLLDLDWIKGAGHLDDDFLISRYQEEAEGMLVSRTIYMEVNCGTQQQEREAEYVIGLCEREDNPMCAVIAGGHPASPDFADFVRGFKDHHYVVGTRQVLQSDHLPRGFCLEPAFVDGVRLLGELGLTFDLCLRPAELADGVALMDQCPETRFIVDHCGNADPFVVSGQTRSEPGTTYEHGAGQWRDDMQALAERANAFCKISGIAMHAKGKCNPEDLAPTVDHCLDTFGSDRVIFGGDWPVCTLGAPLASWITALRQIVSTRPEETQRKLFHENAAKLFGLD